MLSIVYLCIYLTVSIIIVKNILPWANALHRYWIGSCLGFLLLMYLPSLFAFNFSFGITAHILALIVLVLLLALSFVLKSKAKLSICTTKDIELIKLGLITIIPFVLLMAYLQYTHVLKPTADGSLHVGQSTYGDLPLHLSIISSAKNAKFPMDYAILPGKLLSYPFLIDTLSTSLYLLGLNISTSIILPSIIICALIYIGYFILASEICQSKKATVLAFLLLFLNGGLGFIYLLDNSGSDLGMRISEVLNGFYKTPTNQPIPYNLRWSNIIVDMLLPQRTFMGGWLLLLPALYLILLPYYKNRKHSKAELILLIVFASALPMVNTHAFLALGIFSIVQMLIQILQSHNKKQVFITFLIYGIATLIITLPQLYFWTFSQALDSSNFLKLQFNWVNNPNGNGLIDGYLWFYLKNIGIIFIFILLAFTIKRHRALLFSAFAIFIVAEFIRFQPNEYDNNKLFYVWFLLCLPAASDYVINLYSALKNIKGRNVLATIFCIIAFTSSTLSIARECVSDYAMFDSNAIDASNYVKQNIEEHKTFITANHHINPISSLCGQNIVCGPDLWLYYHGFNTYERKIDLQNFYSAPVKNKHILQKYSVDYIYISSYERSKYVINIEEFDNNFKLIYNNPDINIYEVN